MAEINDLDNSDSNNTERFPENMSASAVNDGARALEGLISRWHNGTNGSVASSGSSNAYVVADPRTLTAYYDGLVIGFDANHANDDAATVNVDGLGAKAIKKHNDQALASGDIEAGQKVIAIYDGTNFQMLSQLANAPTVSGAYNLNGEELLLDADGDTSITADTDDQIDIKINGADDFQFTANAFSVLSGSSVAFPTTSISDALDEDTMSSNSATAVPTQQSVKAYVDSSVTASTDQTARDLAVTALIEANVAGTSGAKGPLALVDPFTADSLNVKTNATYDATGDYYGNAGSDSLIADGTGSVISDMTNSANAFDGTTSQAQGTAAYLSGTSAYIGKDWGSGNDKIISRYQVWAASNTNGWQRGGGAPTITFSLEGSTTGAWGGEEVELHTDSFSEPAGLGETVDYTSGITVSTAYRYHRVKITSTASNLFDIAEVRFTEPGTATNMTLEPTAATLDTADPTDLSAYFRLEPVVSVTMGTDVVGKLSIDGGSTKATGTWTKIGDYGTDEEIWRLDADVSGQTGSSCHYQVTTANNKEIRLHHCGGILPIY